MNSGKKLIKALWLLPLLLAGVAGSCGPLGFTLGPLIGGALYQVNSALPYAFAALVYVVLFASLGWIGRRVRTHRPGH